MEETKPSDKCRDVAERLFYLYGISKALYSGWDGLRPERRDESIDNISKHLKKLKEEGILGDEDTRILGTNIKELKESSYPRLLAGLLKDNLLDASINSIAGCKCGAKEGNPDPQKLSPPEKHQLKIAKDTLKMSDAMARVMGGMTKEEAREVVKKLEGKE